MRNHTAFVGFALRTAFLISASLSTFGQGNFYGKTDRQLRYHPDGTDFVVENGKEFFNRPLYGGNTAFRVDAGDKPDFSLYLPGRGGNLRFGIRTAKGSKWLKDADKVTTRYRPGSMVYEIRDSLLGSGVLELTVLATYETEGLLIKAELRNAKGVELVWAFGGASGERGRRDGDIGTEKVPISEFFQLKPEFCKDNRFTIQANNFMLDGKTLKILGTMPPASKLSVGDAANWEHVDNLIASSGKATETPLLLGQISLSGSKSSYFSFLKGNAAVVSTSKTLNESQQTNDVSEKVSSVAERYEDLSANFEKAENYRKSIAGQVVVDTPDPYINAAAASLGVAGDSVWDDQQSGFMHGAVAWRTKLLGWRGPYLGDDLGWHDRMRRHLDSWASKQNTSPIKEGLFTQDATVNFARNEPELHSNGDISNSHYDMNIVYVDALIRHLLWTGDVEFAKKMFPVIKRHLAWEQRLFRREFGPDKLPLYEAYVCIWASDDLQYSGGGVTHASAYNYYHNKMAARIARLIGEDASEYDRESDLILRGMRQNLWLGDRGWYAENKDLLGKQLVHPNAALWTFYHTIDSEAATPIEAWQMSRFVDTQIAHIPVRGAGVPAGGYYTLPTTSWMPYAWSTNNVVMAEAMHTSLGFWQAGRDDEAFKLFKGSILDSMYLGICPGNAGMATAFDMARGESQRDFADGIAMSSRALIEGLFGVKPDALADELNLRPGFPAEWDRASLHHPDIDISFRRTGLRDTYTISSRFPKAMRLRLNVAAFRDRITEVSVNGKKADWRVVDGSVGVPRVEIIAPAASGKYEVVIVWKGDKPETAESETVVAKDGLLEVKTASAKLLEISDPQNIISQNIASGVGGHRTIFAKVSQGDMTWWKPIAIDIRPTVEILPSEKQDAGSLAFTVRNNTTSPIHKTAEIMVGTRSEKIQLNIPPMGDSAVLSVSADGVLPGANKISVKLDDGYMATGVVANWKLVKPVAKTLEPVDLDRYFNDKVTNIFKHYYLSPRSSFVSLAMPKQGIGSWAHWDEQFEVDDTGLRKLAGQNEGRIGLPSGVLFQTPPNPGQKNIAFTSQWDNFPKEITIPLNGTASHVYLLMAGSSNQMQSRMDNGEVIVTYADGSSERLALNNPVNWWPIDQDYFIDDYAFRRPDPLPVRIDLKTGRVRVLDMATFKGKGSKVPGGAATVLDLPLDRTREIKSLKVCALTNEVIIGLMSATLVRN